MNWWTNWSVLYARANTHAHTHTTQKTERKIAHEREKNEADFGIWYWQSIQAGCVGL